MKSYVRILGPPLLEAIRALDKIALKMEGISVMNPLIQLAPYDYLTTDETRIYFESVGTVKPSRYDSIISKSGESLGEYDYYFEWFQRPRMKDIQVLLEKIDEALKPLGCQYAITTK